MRLPRLRLRHRPVNAGNPRSWLPTLTKAKVRRPPASRSNSRLAEMRANVFSNVPQADCVVDGSALAGQSSSMSHWMPGALASRASVVSNEVAPDISVNAT